MLGSQYADPRFIDETLDALIGAAEQMRGDDG
jgi:hypothetical protein